MESNDKFTSIHKITETLQTFLVFGAIKCAVDMCKLNCTHLFGLMDTDFVAVKWLLLVSRIVRRRLSLPDQYVGDPEYA